MTRLSGLLVGCRDDFFERSEACPHFHQTRLSQISYSIAARLVRDVHGRAFGQDDSLNFFADRHHLVDTDPASVAIAAG